MSAMHGDLDDYCARIGYAGERRATLDVLRRLQGLHTRAIAFENLSPLLGEPVKLDVPSLMAKLVRGGRGGWCFEHNLLFTHVLRAFGFEVKTLAARVRWGVPPGVVTSRSHMLMLVTLEGERHIADVGFGGLTLTAPLVLAPGIEQATPHEPHRLMESGDAYVLEARVGGEWQALYAFDLHEQLQSDYEVSSWYLAHHPQSIFVNGLMAARADTDRRHALRNTRYSIHHADGSTERRLVGSVAELRAVLEGPLAIPLPDSPRLDLSLQKVIDAHPPT